MMTSTVKVVDLIRERDRANMRLVLLVGFSRDVDIVIAEGQEFTL